MCFVLVNISRLREERVDERGHSIEPKPRDLSSHNGNLLSYNNKLIDLIII